MYLNPVTKSENGLVITTCTPDSESSVTRVRYMAHIDASYRVSATMTVSKETVGSYSNLRGTGKYEVRWQVGHKAYAVKHIATEADALAIAEDRWARAVAKLEAYAAKLAA